MGKKIDLTGKRFGRLTVWGDSGERKCGTIYWDCICDCGTNITINGNSLRRGRTKSCGCLRIEMLPAKRFKSSGELNPNWKGGFTISRGYYYIRKPNHPNTQPNKYIKRSRLIVEKNIGRYLESDEVVHHINEDKTDDSISNLMVLNIPEHTIFHNSLRRANA